MALHSTFAVQDATESLNHYLREMTKEINLKGNDYILNVDVDQWRQYFIDKYDFEPLSVYPDKATAKFTGKEIKKVKQFGPDYDIETYKFEVYVPYTGWSFLFMLRPSKREMHDQYVNTPNGNSGDITGTFTLYEQDERKFEYEKKRIIHAICVNVPNINSDLASFKPRVISTFNSVYSEKKQKVLSEKSFFEKLNLRIETSTDKIFKIPVIEKKRCTNN